MSSIDPSPGVGEPPLTLSGTAKSARELFAALLSKRKAVTMGDSAALEVLASTFVEWQELSADIQREGRVYECIIERPAGDIEAFLDMAGDCGAHLGLSADAVKGLLEGGR
jgi:hypothetical protein